ncbi:hypothetical protein OKA05_28895 [Luteolibacter arcticus]|uniref:Uncharacterized protein n=1 Tax=Luteolibacter arcticus TaxID=1581411 RepID=A0ABT3GSW0_9BACT|nr:hypothetical protein [Luteolibacter arcticus]MCW1926605.1 hypothetical protein [Luteolibacter arcticus]
MNPRDPHHEIGDLLRSQKPDPQPSPGLERRILHALPSREKAVARRIWPWFLLPPAVAMGVLIFSPKANSPSGVVQRPAPEAKEKDDRPETTDAVFSKNPLERETVALKRDASRAGRFLIDCLPSMGGNE